MERSSRDSIERVICLYFSGMHRKSFSMALSSPALRARFSHSLRSACSVVLRARSLLMRAAAITSQASLAVHFLESENCISDGTAE
jgi:hypothetical protein